MIKLVRKCYKGFIIESHSSWITYDDGYGNEWKKPEETTHWRVRKQPVKKKIYKVSSIKEAEKIIKKLNKIEIIKSNFWSVLDAQKYIREHLLNKI